MPNSPTDVKLILLKLHSSTTTKTEATSSEVSRNFFAPHGNAGGHAFNHSDKFRTV
jgi:hypothetical protein